MSVNNLTGKCHLPGCNKEVPNGYTLYCCQAHGTAARRIKYKAQIEEAKEKADHVCDFTHGFCIKCRNAKRWKEYKANPFPVFGKSGRFAKQASIPG
jgi:hypothetical protein